MENEEYLPLENTKVSQPVKEWYRTLVKFYKEYKNEMSERQQSLYRNTLLDSFPHWRQDTTVAKELKRLRDTFDQMECPCEDEKLFKEFYKVYARILFNWFALYENGKAHFDNIHRQWITETCLGKVTELEFRQHIDELNSEIIDAGLLNDHNRDKMCVHQESVYSLAHDCMLGRHLIWSIDPFTPENVSKILGYFYLSKLTFESYLNTLEYPRYISQLPDDIALMIKDKARYTKWADAMNGPMQKYIGSDLKLWDEVGFVAKLEGFIDQELSRENIARLFSAICPSLGPNLYSQMKKGNGFILKIEKYDTLKNENELRTKCEKLRNML